MDLYKYLCFILLTTVCYIDATYVLTENEYTWSQATNVCTLATPSLSYTVSGTRLDQNISLGTEFWVGYIETLTAFEYFGCAKKSVTDLNTTDYITEGDPGQCWSACNNVELEAVAVYRNECYCLLENVAIDNLLNNYCDLGCPSQSNIVCGGIHGQEVYVSLYKTTYTGPIQTNDLENNICLWYMKDNSKNNYFWGNCTENYVMSCYTDAGVILSNANKNDNWITMTTKCFRDRAIPSNYNNTKDLNTTVTANMWTGIIRNDVIYPITNTTNVTEGKYGYVNITTGQLLFTTNNTVRKRALCVNGTVKNDTTSSTVETTTSTGTTAASTDETTTSTGTTATSTAITTNSASAVKTTTSTVKTTTDTVETSTSTVSQTSSSSSNEQTDISSHATYESEGTTGTTDENTTGKGDMLKNGSSDVGAIIGATVAIIIVIIVVIVLVVIWKRGIKFPFKKARKLEKEKKQATNLTYSFARPDNTIQGADETSFTNYAEVDVSKMTLSGEVKQNGDTNRTSCSSDEPHTYFVLEKVDQGPYDKTKTTPQIHDQHTFNPYNKISIEESSNYDHIGAHVNDYKTLGLDNPYNTTKLTSSNKFNGFTNNAFNINSESDDTYNHIDDQSRHTERNHSDNPYNTTALGHSKNDHGVTNIAFNINDERDDTYNHIGDQSAQNYQTITDNPYNTTTLGNSQTNGVNNSTFNNNNDSEDTYNHINCQVPITRPTFTDNDYATLK